MAMCIAELRAYRFIEDGSSKCRFNDSQPHAHSTVTGKGAMPASSHTATPYKLFCLRCSPIVNVKKGRGGIARTSTHKRSGIALTFSNPATSRPWPSRFVVYDNYSVRMSLLPTMRSLTIGILIAGACTLVKGQLVDPYPMSNCNSGIAGLELQCPDANGCCKGGAACCAGGCCPLLANCINFGTSDEGCCPFSDTTNCGFGVTTFVSLSWRTICRVPSQ